MSLKKFTAFGFELWAILALLGILLGGFSKPATAQASPSTWTKPQDLGSGWFPTIAADGSGRVHVAWSWSKQIRVQLQGTPVPGQLPPGYDQVLYAYTEDGQNFSPVNDIAAFNQNGGSEVTRPYLLIDSHGILHMSYRDVGVFYSQAPVLQADTATAWTNPYPFSSTLVSYYSQVGMDSKGRLHLVYTENVITTFCMACYHVYYSYSDDNGHSWSDKVDISGLPTGSAKPQLLIDKDNNLFVVWEAGNGGAYGQLTDPTTVMYAASYDRGAHWTQPLEFFIPNAIGKNITIGQDGSGNIVVAWLSEPKDQIYYEVSSNEGRSWSKPQAIGNVWGEWSVYPSRLDDLAMATDSAGNIHMALIGRTSSVQKTLDVINLVWDGFAWGKPDVITTLSGDVPEWPRIAISDGNVLNVVWFVRDQAHIWNSDRGNYHVFYSRSLTDAPGATPLAWPTPTPTVTPAPTTIPPTPTPTPINPVIYQTPVDPNLATSVYRDTDDLLSMVKALIPSALILVAVFGFLRWRRR
jgi:hypothetical protein